MSDAPSTPTRECEKGDKCACAVATRHFWFESFCKLKEREAAALPVSAPAWQPIETAPKDGKPIIVTDQSNAAIVTRDEDDDVWLVHSEDYVNILRLTPTHWMPLPDPPVSAPAGASQEP